jgi:hypothetical protein
MPSRKGYLMTQQANRPKGSETSGFQRLGQVGLNLTGPQHGERGSAITVTADLPKVGHKDPLQTDRNLLAALTSQFGVSKRLRACVMVGEPDYAMIPDQDADFVGAIALVRQSMEPATDLALTKALAVLEVSTVRGKESQDKAALGDAVYLRTLGNYPADVALAALHELTLTSRWAPALSEIVDKCERMVQKRRDMLVSLEWSAKQPMAALLPKPAPERPVDFDTAPVMSVDPAPPVRSAVDMAATLRGLSE